MTLTSGYIIKEIAGSFVVVPVMQEGSALRRDSVGDYILEADDTMRQEALHKTQRD
ncbi:MAG: hypothetical protein II838_02010 [Lachnospiraceae bacterium]|nr:hypothetical protein [Lachnospiraceae bacterium]